MTLPVHRIIPFSNVEGIGNRTSIFVQGCNLNCIYCHNSETIALRSKMATDYTISELVAAVKQSMPFIRGVTVSGGEATLYHLFLAQFFREIKKLGLTTYLDSNGFFDYQTIADLIEQTDKFLFDLKGDQQSLKKLCFTSSLAKPMAQQVNLDNLTALLKRDKVEEVRLVYLKDYFLDDEFIAQIAAILRPYPDVLFKLIGVHNKGLPTARQSAIKDHLPSRADLAKFAKKAEKAGISQIRVIF